MSIFHRHPKTPKGAPDGQQIDTPQTISSTDKDDTGLKELYPHPKEEAAVKVVLAVTAKNPVFSRVLGPVGAAFVPIAKQAPHLIKVLKERNHLKKDLDAAGQEMAVKSPSFNTLDENLLVFKATSLGSHARAKDMQAAVAALKDIVKTNDEQESKLAVDYQGFLNRRNEALETLGSNVPPAQEDWIQEKKPDPNAMPPELFVMQDVHKFREIAEMGVDLGLRMTSIPKEPMPGSKPKDPLAEKDVYNVSLKGFSAQRQAVYESRIESRTDDLPRNERDKYTDGVVATIAQNWKHASQQDKKLASQLLENQRMESQGDSKRLHAAAEQLQGYPGDALPGFDVTRTFATDVEDLEARAAIVKGKAPASGGKVVQNGGMGIEGPLATPVVARDGAKTPDRP